MALSASARFNRRSTSIWASLPDGTAATFTPTALITHGPFFSPTYLGNFLTVSNLEAGPVARLYSFWYEQNAFNDRLSIRAGLMSADSQFLQSKTAANFINNGISWPMFLAANLPGGGPAYPLPAPGIRVRIKPRDDVAFQAAVFSGDPSGATAPTRSFRFPPALCSAFAAAPSSSRN